MRDNVFIVGATSGIARPLCRRLAGRGCRLLLAGRREDELQRIAADLRVRYRADVAVATFEALEFETHREFVDRCTGHFDGGLTGVVFCVGYLAPQATTQSDVTAARHTIDVNLTAAVSVLHPFADYLEQRGKGWMVVVSSVAGDRGRQSNYTYGSSKAGLTVFLQGLRNRLHRAGVRVLTVKPGPVDTSMTAGMVESDSWLMASPERIAAGIDRALRGGRNVVYLPGYWRVIMAVIRAIPEAVFKRLKL